VVEESSNERLVDVGQEQIRWRLAETLLGEGEEQSERVAVGGDGVRARAAAAGAAR
jgi:hypothetical protein